MRLLSLIGLGAKTTLPRRGGGRDKDSAPSGRRWQGQRQRFFGAGVVGAKTALPRGRGGRGKVSAPSGRGWRGRDKDSAPSGRTTAVLWFIKTIFKSLVKLSILVACNLIGSDWCDLYTNRNTFFLNLCFSQQECKTKQSKRI